MFARNRFDHGSDCWVASPMKMVIALCISACALTGCANDQKTDAMLLTLQEGKARGHLVFTTNGQVGAQQTTTFAIGATGSHMSFDGDVNFADAEFFEEGSGPDDEGDDDG